MELSMNTELLQSMVARSMKGASCNKMIPLTGLMAIELKDNVLTLITTDASNYLYIKSDKIVGDDFYVVVQAEVFSKLISRLTCSDVKLDLEENYLRIVGNGSYKIDLPLNEEGKPIVYPNPVASLDSNEIVEQNPVQLSTMRMILTTAKASLADTLDVPCYTGYYVGDKVITTDTYKMCGINLKLFDEPVLISAGTMNLLDIMTEEDIAVAKTHTHMMFSTPTCVVFGKLMDSIADFQVDVIESLLNQQYDSVCKVSRDRLLQLLDRLALFVSAYDKNGVYLTFTRDGLQIESKKANSVELIEYTESENFRDFTCCIDIEMFRSQIKANMGDAITIHYGDDAAIQLTDGYVTQVIALLEDDR